MLQRPGTDSLPLFDDADAVAPNMAREEHLRSNGCRFIAGVDEAGRGPLAGPVVAAAVVLDPDNIPAGLNDSKKLSRRARLERLDAILANAAVSWRACSAAMIDRVNIRQATLGAMTGAVHGLQQFPDAMLIDGNDRPAELTNLPNGAHCSTLVRGDARSLSIAAASIVAKCVRDAIMDQTAQSWPQYGFERHAGYGTAFHLEALERHGPCPVHRCSFTPVRLAVERMEMKSP